MSEDKTVAIDNGNKGKEKKVKVKSKHGMPNLVWILGIVILVLLGLVMILPSTCGSTSNLVSFGTYNGKKIELTDTSFLYFQYMQLYNQYVQNYGESMAQIYAQIYGYYIWNSAFQYAVLNEACQEMADKAGFKATKEQIVDAIVDSGYYSSLDVYNSATETQKKQIEAWMKEYVGQQEVFSTISSIPVSTGETSFINTLNSDRRSVEYIVASSSLYPDEDALSYASERLDLFKVISFVRATYSTEDEAAAAFLAYAEGTKTLEEMMDESTDSYKENGGRVDSYYRYQMESDLSSYGSDKVEELYSAEAKTLVGPVETADGYTLFYIESAAADPDYTDESVLDTVRSYIAANDNDVIKAYLDTVIDTIYTDAVEDFDNAAEKYGLDVQTFADAALNTGESRFIYSFNYDQAGYLSTQAEADSSWAKKVFASDYNTVLEPFYANNAYVIARPVESSGNSTASYMTSYFTSYYSNDLPTYTVSDFASELFLTEKAVNDVSNGYKTLMENNLSSSN